jgi:tripartite-type tricarboxylate transporter receptor subunit TctC
MRRRLGFVLAVVGAGLAASSAAAQTEFYKGKTVTVVLGDPPGGGADTYARLFAQALTRFLPGAPTTIVQNMPGASSLLSANYVYKTAPRDGTVIGMPQAAAIFARMFGNKAAAFEPGEFQWIGNLDQATGTCSAWKGSGLSSFDDLLNKPTLLAASAPSGVASEYPRAFNALYGTRTRVIHGYTGTSNIVVAMQNGEVQGSCAFMVSALRSAFRGYFEAGDLRPIIQTARRDPTLVGVPHILDFARNEDERQVMRLVTDRDVMARTMVVAPGVPADRVALLRAAFDSIVKDREFLDGAARAGLPIEPSSAAEVDALVKGMTGAKPEHIARARAALETGETENVALTSLSGTVAMAAAGSVEILDKEGGRHTIKLAPERSVIMVAGAQGRPETLQPGMACSLRYGADNVAEVATCK